VLISQKTRVTLTDELALKKNQVRITVFCSNLGLADWRNSWPRGWSGLLLGIGSAARRGARGAPADWRTGSGACPSGSGSSRRALTRRGPAIGLALIFGAARKQGLAALLPRQ